MYCPDPTTVVYCSANRAPDVRNRVHDPDIKPSQSKNLPSMCECAGMMRLGVLAFVFDLLNLMSTTSRIVFHHEAIGRAGGDEDTPKGQSSLA